MQADGNATVVTPGNKPIWSTNTSEHPDSVLIVQADGNLVMRAPGNVAIWASNTGQPTSPTPSPPPTPTVTATPTVLPAPAATSEAPLTPANLIASGQFLPAGEAIVSIAGGYALQMQAD